MRRICTFASLSLLIAAVAVGVLWARSETVRSQTQAIPATSIRTDKTQYRVGEPIKICYTIPSGATPITVTDVQPGGAAKVLLSGVDDGTGGCFGGTITPPTGTECIRIEVFAPFNPGQRIGDSQTCFRVIQEISPLPPPSTPVSITTDRRQYLVGDPIQACYTVAGGGGVRVTNLNADGSSIVLVNTTTDGSPGCARTTAGPATGNECVRVDFEAFTRAVSSAQTCYQVLPAFQPVPRAQTTLRLDRTVYRAGQPVQACFTVAVAGLVVLSDSALGAVYSSLDNGSGGCTTVYAAPRAGRYCLILSLSSPNLGIFQRAEACYQVQQ